MRSLSALGSIGAVVSDYIFLSKSIYALGAAVQRSILKTRR
jgi:hypothetical protein